MQSYDKYLSYKRVDFLPTWLYDEFVSCLFGLLFYVHMLCGLRIMEFGLMIISFCTERSAFSVSVRAGAYLSSFSPAEDAVPRKLGYTICIAFVGGYWVIRGNCLCSGQAH